MESNWILFSFSHLSLTVLTYQLIVSKHKNLHFQRFYLVFAPIIGFLIPFISWNSFGSVAQITEMIVVAYPEPFNQQALSTQSSFLTWYEWIYVSGFILMLSKFLFSYVNAYRLVNSFSIQNEQRNITIRESSLEIPSFSFFRQICINPDDKTSNEILVHETTHASQLHSLDKIVYDVLKVIFWFNPMVWWLNNQLEITHELLADDAVINQNVERKAYAEKIVQSVVGFPLQLPVSTFFKTKGLQKRVRYILNKNLNINPKIMKYTPVVISLVALISVFSAACTQQSLNITEDADIQPMLKNEQYGSVIDFLSSEIKYPESAKKDSAEGKVYIELIVQKDGTISTAKVLKSSGFEALDNEALRVAKAMPAMIPAKKDGKSVSVKFVLPVSFKLSPATSAALDINKTPYGRTLMNLQNVYTLVQDPGC